MACNMPNVNVTYTIVNCRHARDFTNVKAPAPTAQDAQSPRHEPRPEPTTGDARGAALAAHHGRLWAGLGAWAMGFAGLAGLGLLHLYTNFQLLTASQGVKSHNKKGKCQKVKPCSYRIASI